MISHPQVSVYIPWNRTLKRGSKRLYICATVNVLKSAEQGQEQRVLMVVFPKRETPLQSLPNGNSHSSHEPVGSMFRRGTKAEV